MSFTFLADRAMLAGAALAFLLPFGDGWAQSPEPIRIALNDWTGQHISSRIMGSVLERAGYRVDYIEADYLGQFAQLEHGDLAVAMEIWATTWSPSNAKARPWKPWSPAGSTPTRAAGAVGSTRPAGKQRSSRAENQFQLSATLI